MEQLPAVRAPRPEAPGRIAPVPDAEPEPSAYDEILALQQSAGNAAVARSLQRTPASAPGADAGARPQLDTGAHGEDVELLQLKLNHHRGFARQELLLVDGVFGRRTAAAVRDFKRRHHLSPANASVADAVWTELDTEPRSEHDREAHRGTGPEYDRMLEDGLLEVTVAVGFDEHGIVPHEQLEIQRGLTEVRGFRFDPARGAEIRRTAGRPPSAQAGQVYVKENVGTGAEGQPVNCVLTLVTPATASGSWQDGASSDPGAGDAARASALAGMNESDVFLYGGHGRYGTGPDFDTDYVVTVHWDRFSPRPEGRPDSERFTDAEALEHALRIGGGRRAIARFEQMEREGLVEYEGRPGGNIAINPRATADPGSFGNYLINRAEAGAPLAVPDAVTERHYRLWMFNGCNTRDYVNAIRNTPTSGGDANPSLGTRDLDLVVTNRETQLRWYAETLLSTLDGLIAHESAGAILQRENLATPEEANTHSLRGFGDNAP